MLSPPRFPAGTMFCEAGAIKPIFCEACRRSTRVDTAFATGESADGVRRRNSSVHEQTDGRKEQPSGHPSDVKERNAQRKPQAAVQLPVADSFLHETASKRGVPTHSRKRKARNGADGPVNGDRHGLLRMISKQSCWEGQEGDPHQV